ncbi:hypothetical protein BC940DRAFT_294285 [Gongronella butleri]|nr:hypothetical protein BC940DRAFT_294285 [Gongronella butleri]
MSYEWARSFYSFCWHLVALFTILLVDPSQCLLCPITRLHQPPVHLLQILMALAEKNPGHCAAKFARIALFCHLLTV